MKNDLGTLTRRGLVAGAFAAGFAMPLAAQEFPAGKTINIIVPYAAGGATDTGARMMAAGLEKQLGTRVQVLNKPGAASQVGLSDLTRSAPDGLTLAYAVLPTVTTHYLDKTRQATYGRESFQPVGLHFYTPAMLAVKKDSPFKNIKDLVDAAKAKPSSIKISTSGLMAVPHIQVVMLERAAGVKFAAVHFTGGAPSITALLGGHVDLLAGGITDGLQHMKSGEFRILGVAAEARDPAMADVPTMREQGFDVMAASWTGVLAPAGTPKPIVDKISEAIKAVIADPEHRKRLDGIGVEPRYLSPADYTKAWIEIETRMRPVMEAPPQ